MMVRSAGAAARAATSRLRRSPGPRRSAAPKRRANRWGALSAHACAPPAPERADGYAKRRSCRGGGELAGRHGDTWYRGVSKGAAGPGFAQRSPVRLGTGLPTVQEATYSLDHAIGTPPEKCHAACAPGRQPRCLAIIDDGMPGMSGHEFVAVMARTHPHLQIVLMSGFAGAADRWTRRTGWSGCSRSRSRPRACSAKWPARWPRTAQARINRRSPPARRAPSDRRRSPGRR